VTPCALEASLGLDVLGCGQRGAYNTARPKHSDLFRRYAMSALKPITIGIKVGRWTTLAAFGVNTFCVCDCGSFGLIRTGNLRNGVTASCGCLKRENFLKAVVIHGHSRIKSNGGLRVSQTYTVWQGIHARCTNPKHIGYKNYGGRGISVCGRWDKFENFLADMGEKPEGLSIDRKDNDGNYEPRNCRWATRLEQRHNSRPRPAMLKDMRTGRFLPKRRTTS